MTVPTLPNMGDSGDDSDSKWQQCEQDIEDLEARVSAIEQKLGIGSPTDEAESSPAPMKKGKPGAAPFFGSYS